jgi:ketosteroid isomerase-like protein
MSGDQDARLQRLEDLAAISQLFIDYGRHLDAGDFGAYAGLFADDGEVLLGPMGRAKGPDAIRSLMASQLDGSVGLSYHLITSPMISLDGDTATSSTMWTVLSRTESGSPEVTMVGRHEDELVRTPDGWRFKRRRGYVDLPSVLPQR